MEEKDIFKVVIDENAGKSIQKIYYISRIIFLLGLLVEILVLYYAGRNYYRYRSITSAEDWFYFWDLRIYSVYALVFAILAVLQSLYFLEFSKEAKKGVITGDSNVFNHSLKWMYRSLRVAVILTSINGLFFLYSLLFGR